MAENFWASLHNQKYPFCTLASKSYVTLAQALPLKNLQSFYMEVFVGRSMLLSLCCKMNLRPNVDGLTHTKQLLNLFMFSFIAFRRNINYLSSKLLIWENQGIKHQKTLPDMVYKNQF